MRNASSCTLLLLLTAGCLSAAPALTPADDAIEIAGETDATLASDKGVSVVAEPIAWPGDGFIRQRVTPIRVTVTNHSDETMLVRYSDFELVSSTGERHHALPPLALDGTVDTTDRHPNAVAPGVEYDNFALADRYVSAFPGIRRYNGPFAYDHDYYTTYHPHWDFEERLPTPEMIRAALPEGVLDPGGYISGWLYFEKIDDDDQRVQLRAAMSNVAEEPVARLSIPFETK